MQCKNCGADKGLHHYKTMQCPKGGIEETREGHKQVWMDTVFMIEEQDILELKEEIASLKSQLQQVTASSSSGERQDGEFFTEEEERSAVNAFSKKEGRMDFLSGYQVAKEKALKIISSLKQQSTHPSTKQFGLEDEKKIIKALCEIYNTSDKEEISIEDIMTRCVNWLQHFHLTPSEHSEVFERCHASGQMCNCISKNECLYKNM